MKRRKFLQLFPVALIIALLVQSIAITPAAAAGIQLDEYAEVIGEDIEIYGTGFYPGSEYYIQYPIAWNFDDFEGTVGSTGSFTKHFEVPTAPGGSYRIYVNGYDSKNESWSASLSFRIESLVEGLGKYFTVGEKLTLDGYGFGGGDYVYIYFDDFYDENDSSTYEKVKTTSKGVFSSFSYTVPEVTGGQHDFIVIDEDENMWEKRMIVNSLLTAKSSEAAIGEIIKVSGRGFGKAANVSFFIDDVKLTESAVSDAYGSFDDIEITVPAIASGKHELRASDTVSNTAMMYITTMQAIDISPTEGLAESIIEISGEGFPGNTSIYFSMAGISLGSTRTDAEGYFNADVTAPKLPAGNYKIIATDGDRVSMATYSISNGVILSADSGSVGDIITANGYGFNTNTTIAIKFDGVDIAAAKSNSNGEFTAEFPIPAVAGGDHQLIITDGINPVILTFSTGASATVDNVSGNVGMLVNVTGKSFEPNGKATITFDYSEVGSVDIDENGSFSTSFSVPAGKGGDHTITISDGLDSVEETFTVETKAPPTPNLISPANMEQTSASPIFNWEAVSDPSGVYYSLQVATDSSFNNITAEKTKISGTSYTLLEKLKAAGEDAPYYWRIKAVDGASNESSWSAPQSFTVSSNMIMIIIIAASAVVVLLAGWFIYSKVIRR